MMTVCLTSTADQHEMTGFPLPAYGNAWRQIQAGSCRFSDLKFALARGLNCGVSEEQTSPASVP